MTKEPLPLSGKSPLLLCLLTSNLLLVHLCDLSWSQIVPSLRLMQSKLINLGLEYYNGNIVISETETEGSQYHT